ncbi:hypothetical protein JOF53_002992 [Crossiella equi]|uniref:Uncharacterized protein n=1 Tax=Crossiella equi TaxID=130796 RepID=A0ABS5AC18_9PSEU|nr:hypothetical protein [Crossiella equi]MBP2474120.1 hypothetical protein [Crossiella equi]
MGDLRLVAPATVSRVMAIVGLVLMAVGLFVLGSALAGVNPVEGSTVRVFGVTRPMGTPDLLVAGLGLLAIGGALQRGWRIGIYHGGQGLVSRTVFRERTAAWPEITGVVERPFRGEATTILLLRGDLSPVRVPLEYTAREDRPGNPELRDRLEALCREHGSPLVSVLPPTGGPVSLHKAFGLLVALESGELWDDQLWPRFVLGGRGSGPEPSQTRKPHPNVRFHD